MARMLHIMLIIGIVDYPLKVAFVVTDLHFMYEDIIFLIHNLKVFHVITGLTGEQYFTSSPA